MLCNSVDSLPVHYHIYLFIYYLFIYLSLSLCVCVLAYMCEQTTYGIHKTVCGSRLLLPYMNSRDWTQIMRPGSKPPYH